VDRSGAYMARYAAKKPRRLRGSRTASRSALAYAIGVLPPGLGLARRPGAPPGSTPQKLEAFVQEFFDFRPAAIIHNLDLRRPIYKATSSYGHFGRPDKDGFSLGADGPGREDRG